MGRLDQAMEGGEVAQLRMNVSEICDVVSAITQGRGINRGQPDGIHPKPAQVGQPILQPLEISDAITVGIAETARHQLIDHGAIPPGMLRCSAGFGLSRHELRQRFIQG